MKLGAFRIRPLPGGDYLDYIFSLMQSSPVLGRTLYHCSYQISPNFFVLQVEDQFAFSIYQQCPFVHTV